MDSKITALKNLIFTVTDRNNVLDQIDLFSQQLYTISDNKKLLSKYADLLSDIFVDSSLTSKVIADTRDAIAQMKIVEIKLAYEPRIIDIEKIAVWIKNNLGSDCILDWSVDFTMIAGLKITANGKFVDNSIDVKLQSYWDANGRGWFKTLGIDL